MTTNTKIGFSYARYSSSKQDDGLSVEAQHGFNAKYAAASMDLEIKKEFTDRAKTGTNFNREQINAMKRSAKNHIARGFDVYVFIYDVSRLGRNIVGNEQFRLELQSMGVKTFITSDNTNISKDDTFFMFGIKSLLAQQQSLDNGRRTSQGMQQAFEMGFLPMARLPFGYDKVTLENTRKTGTPNDGGFLLQKVLFEYLEKGTEKRILWKRYLPKVRKSTFYEFFTPHRLIFYSGRIPRPMTVEYERIVEGKHKGIISVEQCDMLIKLWEIEKDRTNEGKVYVTNEEYNELYWLKGLLWDEKSEMLYTSSPTTKAAKNEVRHYYKPREKGVSIPVKKAHAIIMSALKELQLDDETYNDLQNQCKVELSTRQESVQKEIKGYEKDLVTISEKIISLDNKFDEYRPEVYERLSDNLQTRKTELQKEIEKSYLVLGSADTTMLQVLNTMRNIAGIMEVADVDYKKNILQGIFGDRISIDLKNRVVRTAFLNPIIVAMCCKTDNYNHILIADGGILTASPLRGT